MIAPVRLPANQPPRFYRGGPAIAALRGGPALDFGPEDWVASTTLVDVIRRHAPELAAVLPADGNAFAPWRSAGA